MPKFSQTLARWWWEITIQTRLLAAATIIIGALASGFTFWALNLIQEDARESDQRFGESVGQLLAVYAAPLIQDKNITGLIKFTEGFRRGNSNILYIIYLDRQGNILEGSPFTNEEPNRAEVLRRRVDIPESLPATREHSSPSSPSGRVTDIFFPIYDGNQYLGVVALGINANPTLVTSSRLAIEVTIAVGILVGLIALLGAVFNALTITQPLKELVAGVRGISQRNFQQRIILPFGGELGELIRSFNTMADRLQGYEAQNIEEMTAEKARLETLLTTIADGALLLDNNLTVQLVNPAADRILQWEINIVGHNLLDRLPVGLRVEVEDLLVKVAKGELEQAESRVLLDHPQRTLRVLMSPVLTGMDLSGVVLTIQDISREAELNEAKTRFIGNVSHELRTPLHCVRGFIETLLDFQDELEPERQREFLETALRETDRLTRLVNDVLDLSRLESGREYTMEPLDLVQPMEQTLRAYQLNALEKQITLQKTVDPELPLVIANYDLINQLLANLVGNALKFTPAGGTIEVGAKNYQLHGQDRVRLWVRDTGIGIAPEDQARVFERFFRVENRVHTLEGTGLGLSIVCNIAEKHYSKIQLTSALGEGTMFWLDLELYQETRVLA
ncbi:ATP-binding protein [Candidatus Cyanaurora vandensis]|uniref:HAMP domain-containing sensor histidine kinase n=1 Tax=Candidatus Cyanaurora vandensis TaxID=2714958 RepID=UPI00257AB290|nr:ATP-binding protein [Candidatus Cyanaurora vandensis]